MQDHATTNQGRNTGAITGCTNVGGMVGYNTADSYLKFSAGYNYRYY